MLDAHLIVHAIASSSHTLHTLGTLMPAKPAGTQPPGAPITIDPLNKLLGSIAATLWTVGGVLCVIGLIIGGIMRATAFGSERRIATSNVALSCAVLGFLIILLAQPISDAILNIFK